ncbi:hypothetical protein WR25_06022 [Diploscapter pachys]|uniref:Uncharacterized protein n=1 Tax=Diploscapter pachys TaxID=2018661 RepID=A0A2A2LQL4_9BILA|nr:hypothetical protein WR25_06022 [Diploscapter pachys]
MIMMGVGPTMSDLFALGYPECVYPKMVIATSNDGQFQGRTLIQANRLAMLADRGKSSKLAKYRCLYCHFHYKEWEKEMQRHEKSRGNSERKNEGVRLKE